MIVHRGMDRVVEPSPPYDKERLGLRVGILGNTYGYRQLLILGRAVAEAAKKLGVPGRLLVVGAGHGERLRCDLARQVAVEYTGHIDEPEAVRHLQRCFLLYLNYPFPTIHVVRRQTSFPTKLSTYVQAARPLLIHAPADSSVTLARAMTGYAHCWEPPGRRMASRSSRGSGPTRREQRASTSTATACAPATSTSIQTAGVSSTPSTLSADLGARTCSSTRTDINRMLGNLFRSLGYDSGGRGKDSTPTLTPISRACCRAMRFGSSSTSGLTWVGTAQHCRTIFPDAMVHSFEPFESTFRTLSENCRGDGRIEPHQACRRRCSGSRSSTSTRTV